MKRFFCVLLVLIMICGVSTETYAADKSKAERYFKIELREDYVLESENINKKADKGRIVVSQGWKQQSSFNSVYNYVTVAFLYTDYDFSIDSATDEELSSLRTKVLSIIGYEDNYDVEKSYGGVDYHFVHKVSPAERRDFCKNKAMYISLNSHFSKIGEKVGDINIDINHDCETDVYVLLQKGKLCIIHGSLFKNTSSDDIGSIVKSFEFAGKERNARIAMTAVTVIIIILIIIGIVGLIYYFIFYKQQHTDSFEPEQEDDEEYNVRFDFSDIIKGRNTDNSPQPVVTQEENWVETQAPAEKNSDKTELSQVRKGSSRDIDLNGRYGEIKIKDTDDTKSKSDDDPYGWNNNDSVYK